MNPWQGIEKAMIPASVLVIRLNTLRKDGFLPCLLPRSFAALDFPKALYRARDSGRERHVGEGRCAICVQVAPASGEGRSLRREHLFEPRPTLIRRAARRASLPLGEGIRNTPLKIDSLLLRGEAR